DLGALAANQPSGERRQVGQVADKGRSLSAPALEHFGQAFGLFAGRQFRTLQQRRRRRHRSCYPLRGLLSSHQRTSKYLVQGDSLSLHPCPKLLRLGHSLVTQWSFKIVGVAPFS